MELLDHDLIPDSQKVNMNGKTEGVKRAPLAFLPTFLRIMVLGLSLLAGARMPAAAADYQVKPVTMVTMDNNGQPLRLPYAVFFDDATNETYLITGGKAQVSVFASDFFPMVTIGPGREIYTPQGGFVDQDGQVYICQSPKEGKPARITVLNAAFIVVREIPIEDIPGAANFVPRRVAVSRDGLIYVSSQHRGVLVLDSEGGFLRWLKPMDKVARRLPTAASEENPDGETNGLAPTAEEPEPAASTGDIPEEFRATGQGDSGLAPVLVRAVTIDQQGNLYLVSSETGKVYVYNAEETFLFSFGTKGGTPGRLSQPRGVAVDHQNKLMYVVDYMRHSVLVYNDKGEYLFEFGGKGAAPGWFKFPTDLIVNRTGQLIVSDLFNHRLQVFEVKYSKEAPSLERLMELASPPEESKESAEPDQAPPEPLIETVTPDSPAAGSGPAETEILEEILPEEELPSYPDEPEKDN
jgi:DNA-binding beta-propeller fold protein YncE